MPKKRVLPRRVRPASQTTKRYAQQRPNLESKRSARIGPVLTQIGHKVCPPNVVFFVRIEQMTGMLL
jgi:hypothetical protein